MSDFRIPLDRIGYTTSEHGVLHRFVSAEFTTHNWTDRHMLDILHLSHELSQDLFCGTRVGENKRYAIHMSVIELESSHEILGYIHKNFETNGYPIGDKKDD